MICQDAPPLVPVRFYIIGGPIYATTGSQFSEHELRAMARQIGVAEHVGFIPFQADPAAVYRALDVVAHASVEPEPFGRTIVEAMSCGRAIIATAAGGAGEIVTDGVDALAVGPRDVEQLAAAIARLCRDAALRARIGAGGRATAVSRFSRERLGREMLGVYRSGARR